MGFRRGSVIIRVLRKIFLWDDDQSRDPLSRLETFIAVWILYFSRFVFMFAAMFVLVYGAYFLFLGEFPNNPDLASETALFLAFLGVVSFLPAAVITIFSFPRKSKVCSRQNDFVIEDSKVVDEDER